jgi:hypothetical protein
MLRLRLEKCRSWVLVLMLEKSALRLLKLLQRLYLGFLGELIRLLVKVVLVDLHCHFYDIFYLTPASHGCEKPANKGNQAFCGCTE